MATAFRRPVVRWVSGGALTASLLAACGGGEVIAILQIVTPLAGAWNSANNNEQIVFDEDIAQVFDSELNVSASLSSDLGVCGANGDTVQVSGRLDNGKLTLRKSGESANCLEGRFVDLRRLDAEASGSAPARSYFNSRVDVRMEAGVWVTANGRVKLKFNEPSSVNNNSTEDVSGCDVSDAAAKVAFKGKMFGFNTGNGARPSIPELLKTSDNSKLFTGVDYVDGDSITLRNAAGETLTLTRKNEQASCS